DALASASPVSASSASVCTEMLTKKTLRPTSKSPQRTCRHGYSGNSLTLAAALWQHSGGTLAALWQHSGGTPRTCTASITWALATRPGHPSVFLLSNVPDQDGHDHAQDTQ